MADVKKNLIIVYTTGVFDLLHPGHLNILRKARALGDKLIVGVQEDESIRMQKGKLPILSCEMRVAMLEALPFVDAVVTYGDLDQSKMLDMIKPDVLVQGGDWLETSDRTVILQYLREHNIRLVQFPYTKNISSTTIKERVYETLDQSKKEKLLQFNLFDRLKLVSIDDLLVYENNDPRRTNNIIESIKKTGQFINPISVGQIRNGKFLVIDGANRLEAVRQLRGKYILVQIVDYLMSRDFVLRSNEHYLDIGSTDFINLAKDAGINLVEKSDFSVIDYIENFSKKLLASIKSEDKEFLLLGTEDLVDDTRLLNKLVNCYKSKFTISRKSEIGESKNSKTIISFKKFTPSDLVEMVQRNIRLESGITWHVVNNSVIRFKLPIEILTHSISNTSQFIANLIADKSKNGRIRKYISGVYICDEWEDSLSSFSNDYSSSQEEEQKVVN